MGVKSDGRRAALLFAGTMRRYAETLESRVNDRLEPHSSGGLARAL
jgi:hypothetical protein